MNEATAIAADDPASNSGVAGVPRIRPAHSYFVTTDGDGNVLSSSPEIAKHY